MAHEPLPTFNCGWDTIDVISGGLSMRSIVRLLVSLASLVIVAVLLSYYYLGSSSEDELDVRGMYVSCMAISPKTDMVATVADNEDAIRFWDLATRRVVHTIRTNGATVGDCNPTSIAFSSNGELVGAGSVEGNVYVWEAANYTNMLAVRVHERQITGVAFPDDNHVVSSSMDGTVRITDLTTQQSKLVFTSKSGESKPGIDSMTWSENQKLLALGTYAQSQPTIVLVDITSEKESARLFGQEKGPSCLCFSKDGKELASGAYAGLVVVWDIARKELLVSLRDQTDFVSAVLFTPTGNRLVTIGRKGDICVYDARTWQLEGRLNSGCDLRCAAISTKSGSLLIGTRTTRGGFFPNAKVKIWDLESLLKNR